MQTLFFSFRPTQLPVWIYLRKEFSLAVIINIYHTTLESVKFTARFIAFSLLISITWIQLQILNPQSITLP